MCFAFANCDALCLTKSGDSLFAFQESPHFLCVINGFKNRRLPARLLHISNHAGLTVAVTLINPGDAAMTTDYYPIKPEMVNAMRSADVLTGEFSENLSPKMVSDLRALGLAEAHQSCLTARGRAVRSWLMRGAPSAPRQVALLLGEGGRSVH